MMLPEVIIGFEHWQLVKGACINDGLVEADHVEKPVDAISVRDSVHQSPVLDDEGLHGAEACESTFFETEEVLACGGCTFWEDMQSGGLSLFSCDLLFLYLHQDASSCF